MTRARGAPPPATHLALLRGINLGGRNTLPRRDRVERFVEAGCRDARPSSERGTVQLTAHPHAVAPLSGLIAARLAERVGQRVPAVRRTADQLAAVARGIPRGGPAPAPRPSPCPLVPGGEGTARLADDADTGVRRRGHHDPHQPALGAAPAVIYVAGCYAVLALDELLAVLGAPVRDSLLPALPP